MAGIDYGMGRTNIDRSNGIRYGCISMHDITQAWCDSSEPDYGQPHCPRCGNDATPIDQLTEEQADSYAKALRYGGSDYGCHSCEICFDSEQAFPDEPLGHAIETDDYACYDCLDSDVIVVKSPWFTYAPFCSPCVPGAGNLNGAIDVLIDGGDLADGVQTYAFGHSWFDGGVAPYPVFSVATGRPIFPNSWYGSFADD